MKKNGFTLIELLIVIGIISVLAMIAIPGYIGQQRRAARAEAYTNLENLRLLEEQLFAEIGSYTGAVGAAGSTAAIRDANVPAIQAVLTRFRPGPSSNLNYSYRLIPNVRLANNSVPWDGTTVAVTLCFTAVATGVDGTRVAGDIFALDCNNNRNF